MKKDSKITYDSVLCVVVGQKVYLEPSNYSRGEKEPREVTVSKVGRKYFSIEELPYDRYRLSDGVEQNETNYKGKISLTMQEILDRKEHAKLQQELRKIFAAYGTLPHKLDTLRKVAKLISEDNNA